MQRKEIQTMASGQGVGKTHGRYYAEYVREISDEPQSQLQALLDEKDAREWHLVGVVGNLEQFS
jgi:succinate dehydrogenase flavin-adding protein (antitoxin of CptAB toxin-antitoxin module)